MNYIANDNPSFFRDFLNQNFADKSLYQYTYLQNQLESVLNGYEQIYSDSLVNVDNNDPSKWIIIVNTDRLVSIYGSNWDANQINEILVAFDFDIENHSFISGTSKLILEILDKAKIKDYQIGKKRSFYKSSSVKEFDYSTYNIQRPGFERVPELAKMLQMYYHEEYKGNNDKTIQDMYMRINDLILSDEIFTINDITDNSIISFCSIKDSSPGILFTNKSSRNKGYGQILLSYCSNLLLNQQKTIYLMTDADILESNILCQKIGFEKFYDYISIDTAQY
ncbi:GNAT family N-acetyltransferase [Chryseobacterium jejuense]|uniref:GNAT family N-acetyltransferase n=1 Tax=Chryseobacterium jejuense TaxID=445960 RepID=UPI001AE531E0|nr:hypothetical protein [Chryseobacterium jejuense]MBP2615822.1 hypothetical protein [Chryseobacterium jejuense]